VVDEVKSITKEARLRFGLQLSVGIIVGVVMTGIVGPIALAIIVGLATGHH
jgi:hypothetical protein